MHIFKGYINMLQKRDNTMFEKFRNNWVYVLKRIVYIICFVALCLIDQIIGSATGSIQYGLKNYTGIIIAIIILTAYKIKDFIKIPYLTWVILFFIGRNFILDWGKSNFGNYLELQTNLWGILIYGILLIRMFYLLVVERKKPHMNGGPFLVCLLMMIGMAIIRSDWAWPKALLGTFLCFYLTEFKEKDLNNLYSGMAEGIILGFLIIQGQAWMYRPYDSEDMRYLGMYSHANINALLYVCALGAVLCKWYMMKLKRKKIVFRLPYIILAGLIVGTMIFTGSRTAFITTGILVVVFLFFQMLSCKRWKLVELLIDGTVLLLSTVLCIFPAYWLIRYIPAYVDEPIYFEADNEEEKIHKGESIDSDKYVEIDEALKGMFERYLWFQDEKFNIIGSSSVSEVSVGDPVIISGEVLGEECTYTYSYLVCNTTTNKWCRLTSDFGKHNSYEWIATDVGSYLFYVEAKDETGITVRSSGIAVEVVEAETEKLSVIGSSNVSEVLVGNTVTISGKAIGGEGEYTYSYLACNTTTNKWFRLTSSFESNNSYEWTAQDVGSYLFYVEVKDETGTIVRSSEIEVKVVEEETEKVYAEVENRWEKWLKKIGIIIEVEASSGGYVEGDEVYIEPGTDRQHPLILSEKQDGLYDVRLDIYKYFLKKLTLIGEKNNVQGVWLSKNYQATHCHNVLIQMAYDFGIIIGIFFIGVIIMLFNKIILGLTERKSGAWYYRLFITAGFTTVFVVFGMFENVWTYGELIFTMFWVVQYIVYHKQPHEIEAEQLLALEKKSEAEAEAEVEEFEMEDLD